MTNTNVDVKRIVEILSFETSAHAFHVLNSGRLVTFFVLRGSDENLEDKRKEILQALCQITDQEWKSRPQAPEDEVMVFEIVIKKTP